VSRVVHHDGPVARSRLHGALKSVIAALGLLYVLSLAITDPPVARNFGLERAPLDTARPLD
jgi:hypothetical protein